jgi:TPR repeat protein
MMRLSRLSRAVSVALVSAAIAGAVAFAEEKTSKDELAKKEAAARVLAAAIKACDDGAAAPLDPTAKSAPVQFGELKPPYLDKSKLQALQAQCYAAWVGAPRQKRLELQWLRTTIALKRTGVEWLVPQVRRLAEAGSAEGRFLNYVMHGLGQAENSPEPAVSKAEAVKSLLAAAESGHLDALRTLFWQYQGGYLFRRDVKRVVQIGRRIESAPPQGISATKYENYVRSIMPSQIAIWTLRGEEFGPRDQRIAFQTVEADSNAGTNDSLSSAVAYIRALRLGLGTRRDAVRARQLLEKRAPRYYYFLPLYADMLARGEGGPADAKRALALLRNTDGKYTEGVSTVLAGLLLDGKVVGAQPQEAAQVLARSWYMDDHLRLGRLLIGYHPEIENADRVKISLANAAELGEPGAAKTFAELKLSNNPQFADIDGGRALLKRLANEGDREALWLYALTHYTNLDSTSSQSVPRTRWPTDGELMRLIEEGMARKEAPAFLLRAKLTRKGVVYPQDDEAATKLLIRAADLGNVEAMVLLGEAYADGLGTPRNSREKLRAWRKAARLGSLAAKQDLANAFTFDTFDKLMTLDEGLTSALVLFINGVDRLPSGTYSGNSYADIRIGRFFSVGSRAMDAGNDAVADAVMKAFRLAPAGLDEKMLVDMGKAFPDEVRKSIERKLKDEGYYPGEPNGYFGPEVRAALAAWVEATGPVIAEE